MPEILSKKVAYEWVFTMSRGENIVLTENQYAVYDENREGTVVFKDLEINPSFVVSAVKQEAVLIKEKYPCYKCLTHGEVGGKVCPNCEGTGVDAK